MSRRSHAPDVALVAPYPPAGARHAGATGVASYTANLAHALADEGASVTVVALREPGELARSTDGPVRVERPAGRGLRALHRLVHAAGRTGAPVVHVQHEMFLWGGPGAALASLPALAPGLPPRRGQGTPVVVTAHHIVDPSTVDGSYRRMHRIGVPAPVARLGVRAVQAALSGLPDAVVVHEPAFRRVLPEAVLVPHGVEVLRPLDRRTARAELGLDDRFVALCFGFLAPYKGLETAGEAARVAGPDVHLVLAGSEHPRLTGNDPYAEGLRARFGDVATFTGWVSEDDVRRWFSAADVALFPYPQPHASSGALALALAHGTPALLSPALAATVGAPPALVAPAEPGALGAELRRLAASPERRAALARATSGLAEGRSWPAVARAHLDLYRRVRNV